MGKRKRPSFQKGVSAKHVTDAGCITYCFCYRGVEDNCHDVCLGILWLGRSFLERVQNVLHGHVVDLVNPLANKLDGLINLRDGQCPALAADHFDHDIKDVVELVAVVIGHR